MYKDKSQKSIIHVSKTKSEIGSSFTVVTYHVGDLVWLKMSTLEFFTFRNILLGFMASFP